MYNFYLLNWGNTGGAPKMGHHLIRALNDLGIECKYICLSQVCEFDYIQSIASKNPIYKQRELLVHDHFSLLTPGWVIVNSAKNAFAVNPLKDLGFKVILYYHEGPEEIKSLGKGNFLNYTALANADINIHASLLSYNFINRLNFLHEYTSPNILIEPFSSVNFERIFQKRESLFDFGVFGAACLRKGFDRFVELAQSIPNQTFMWGGSTSVLVNEGLGEALSTAKSLRNVELCGFVEPKFFYNSIKALLHLCREDPSPLTSWEAASLRIPQIAFSKDIGNPHLVALNGYLLSGSYNRDQLTEAIMLNNYTVLPPLAGSKLNVRSYANFLADVKAQLIPFF